MRDFLTELGIEELNSGVSCADLNTASGEIIESVSPVDGKGYRSRTDGDGS